MSWGAGYLQKASSGHGTFKSILGSQSQHRILHYTSLFSNSYSEQREVKIPVQITQFMPAYMNQMPAAENTPSSNPTDASREQPWKKFVTVSEKQSEVVFSDAKHNIRMVDGRVDGKGLGG